MAKSKPFCVAPFINFYYKGSVTKDKALPCCEGRLEVEPDKKPFEEWWNGDLFKEVRAAMLDGKAHEMCTRCIAVENGGNYNAREFYQRILDKWERRNDDQIEFSVEGGNQFNAPIAVDYRGSNLCNLKCRMCHPASSSQIAKEVLDNPQYEQYGFSAGRSQLFERGQRNDFVDTLPLEHATRIKLLGGEPLVQEDVYQALDMMLQHSPEETTVVITTNGTTVPLRFVEYLDKFESIALRISLDGIGYTNEYIRTSAHWPKIEENCRRIAELSTEYPSLRAGFTFVVQAYNAFQLADIARFCIEWKQRYPNWREPFFGPVEQDWLSTAVLYPEDVVRILWELEEVDREYPSNDVVKGMYEIVRRFDDQRPMDKDAMRARWKSYTEMQDRIRATDIRDVSGINFTRYFDEQS